MISLSKFSSRFCSLSVLENVLRSTFFLQQRFLRSLKIDGLPEKPKRPPSAWLLFLTERRKELQEQAGYEGFSLTQMSKKVSEEWRNFDELDKIPYKEKYEESLSEYRVKMKDYKSSLTREDKRLLRDVKLHENHDLKEFEKECAKPKYHGSGYNLFVKSTLENPRHKDQDMKDWIRECASKWQNLDEVKKQEFNEQALSLTEKYKEDLKLWKEKYQEWKKHGGASN